MSHTHDDRYYTETEVDTKINNKTTPGSIVTTGCTWNTTNVDTKSAVTPPNYAYVKVGNLCFFHCEFAAKVDIKDNMTILSGMPARLNGDSCMLIGSNQSTGHSHICYVTSTRELCNFWGYKISAGNIVRMAGVYLIAV